MKISYTIIYTLLIIALYCCTIIAKHSDKPSRGGVAWLESSLIIPIAAQLIILLSDNTTLTFIGYQLYFIGLDLVLMALVNFTNIYCTGIGDGTRKPTVMYVGISIDILNLILNPIFKNAFEIRKITENSISCFRIIPHFGQTIHRIIDYGVLICVILIFSIASAITPKIHRERFTVLLTAIIAISFAQAYYTFSNSTYDRSVIGYGIFGLILFYFATYYRPLRLLDQLMSNIVSDLSDAFYIFDSTGKCIWANARGCELVGFEKGNYEVIGDMLVALFGDPKAGGDIIPKKCVGEGDDARFYSLEEKKVLDKNGKPNGSYLRVRDVTNEEREILLRDEQIGQISMEAYSDALTGVGNKAAYINKVNELNSRIAAGLTDFAVVMADMNNLKKINDEYGHKAGDIYIKGCCQTICNAFMYSPVFRIGGDEFVAVLLGQDFAEREKLTEALKKAFEDSFSNEEADPWLRYSASVGMAEYSSDTDTFESVFKRADHIMYEAKKQFKSVHGSYR